MCNASCAIVINWRSFIKTPINWPMDGRWAMCMGQRPNYYCHRYYTEGFTTVHTVWYPSVYSGWSIIIVKWKGRQCEQLQNN